MSRRIILSLTVILATCCSGLSWGQEFPKPGPEHAKLKEMVGTWDAVMEMDGHKSKATAVYKSICGGMWVQNDFEGDLGEITFQGHGLDGYDIHKKKYVGIWVDSMTSSPMRFEGDYDAEKKLLTMTGDSVSLEGKPEKFKNTTETIDKDHFVFKMYMIETGGAEKLAFTISYTRRK